MEQGPELVQLYLTRDEGTARHLLAWLQGNEIRAALWEDGRQFEIRVPSEQAERAAMLVRECPPGPAREPILAPNPPRWANWGLSIYALIALAIAAVVAVLGLFRH